MSPGLPGMVFLRLVRSERGLVVGRRLAPAATLLGALLGALLARLLAAAGGAGCPGVLLLGAPEAATLLAATEAAATAALGLVDLCGGVPQRRADLVDLHLDDGALL